MPKITLEQARKTDSRLNNVPDEELKIALDLLETATDISYELWIEEKSGSKNPVGLL